MEGMERKRTLPPCKNCSGAMVSHSLCCWQFALAVREGLSWNVFIVSLYRCMVRKVQTVSRSWCYQSWRLRYQWSRSWLTSYLRSSALPSVWRSSTMNSSTNSSKQFIKCRHDAIKNWQNLVYILHRVREKMDRQYIGCSFDKFRYTVVISCKEYHESNAKLLTQQKSASHNQCRYFILRLDNHLCDNCN